MKVCIVTGGRIDPFFSEAYLEKNKFDLFIAVDHGADFFANRREKPNDVVGDMDSMKEETRNHLQQWEGCVVHKYPSEKDETDTELAIMLAIEKGAEEIMILGGTGTRLDHVMGNIQIMKRALEAGIPCYMIDECNRIRLVQGTVTLSKKEQYGDYVSLIPWMGEVTGVNLQGVKYPLKDAALSYGSALGISNEITEDTATITIGTGIAVMVESKDRE